MPVKPQVASAESTRNSDDEGCPTLTNKFSTLYIKPLVSPFSIIIDNTKTMAAGGIHGDVLEGILSHVPVIDLVPVSHVSHSWKRAVSSSLAHVRPIKPWLIVVTQNRRASHVTALHAYDPRSHLWLQIKHPTSTSTHASPLCSSHSTLLYTLSLAHFSFSLDALHLHWHHAPSPRLCRTHPLVARVANLVVIAGGVCHFEDDPLAVEIYHIETRTWETCPSMPPLLKGSTASSWLSVAVAGQVMHVTEKHSGVTYSFHTEFKTWKGPFNLRAAASVFHCVTGTLGNRFMLAGLLGEVDDVKGVKLWEVRLRDGLGSGMEEVGEMPTDMVGRLFSGSELGSLEATWIGNFVYLMNSSTPEEFVACELLDGGGCQWRTLRNPAVNYGSRMVVCAGDVRMQDLRRAMTSENLTFCVKHV
ncbi:hypothetical protein VNO78_08983 [Psophocarpus tetragonolobus]|uniref:F-box domain-containing protein n=1 Tax=Psophocarpus tetragonolobus TaxID=3891 RepID=A0AAN9XTT4_PSOTE